MKTAMDVRIRQQKGPSFQNTNQQLRQIASMKIRDSFALREEVIAELPEKYRRVLLSMPQRQREQFLSEIEKKVDRKIQSGAMAKTVARLDVKNQAEIRRVAASGQRMETRHAEVQRYRLQGKTKRIIVARESLEGQGTLSNSPYSGDDPAASIDSVFSRDKDKRRPTGGIQQETAKKETIRRESARPRAGPRAGLKTDSKSAARIGSGIRTDTSTNIETMNNKISINDDAIKSDAFQSPPEAISYQQRLLSDARTKKEKAEIQKSIRAVAVGRVDRANSRILQSAALRTAYLERGSSEAYGHILKEAGFSSDGQKAAAQLAYEKQVRKALKGEYRKQLTGKLSKVDVSSLAKRLQMQKSRQEQMQEDEQSRAMTQQAGQSFGLMAKGTKALRKMAEDAIKAIRALVRKKLVILIIPLLMVLILPFLMMFIPIMGTVTATSYEDNEVYAYADATELIEYAKQWIGKIPYVWGGGHGGSPTAWQSGCDCSGFVHGVFNHFGYEIGGDTGAMETQAGTHIAYDSLAQAKPGDVLIYYRTGAHVKGQPNGNGSTHVSIYIGNNQIIHQSGGVHISNEYHQYFEVRRVLTADVAGRGNISGGLGGMGTYGHRTDATNYSQSDLELIWAIVAQEDNGSYKGALAVISSAMNRVESPTWSYEGSNALAQLTAPGQYCYSNDTYWQARLGGNVPDYVKQAVNDCLKKGKRNHSYTSFRSTKGKTTGADAVQIGGNWFFGH
ncbi:MAG: C40 family peptidase [Porcincola intestinalis]|nr:C40 family peptidase [Porcincola intestinalis]